jgi:hypothetical protein
MPPAQLTVVPLSETQSATSRRRCSSNTSVTVPPPPSGSYADAGASTLPFPAGLRSSLLRINRTSPRRRPRNAAMPSSASGVRLPSAIVLSVWLNVT